MPASIVAPPAVLRNKFGGYGGTQAIEVGRNAVAVYGRDVTCYLERINWSPSKKQLAAATC
ncbi:MAG: hypothetical protein IAF94_12385 [Pirellulaceae bacterium]|nr:hypothetical protein [Pirellulaceae bacterium]